VAVSRALEILDQDGAGIPPASQGWFRFSGWAKKPIESPSIAPARTLAYPKA
jgi:hypothetical protein